MGLLPEIFDRPLVTKGLRGDLVRVRDAQALEEWTRYEGKRGGKGWKKDGQGKPRYQEEMPGERLGGDISRLPKADLAAAGLTPEPRGDYTAVSAKIPMPPQVQTIADALHLDDQVKLYAVGGAVRDYLMNRLHEPGKPYAPKDVDLTTNLSEAEILERLSTPEAKALGIRVKAKESVDTFGVVFANVNGVDFEIAPFRRDVGITDGRRPDHVERGTMEQDAQRRDLTMNNLYYDFGKGEILDLNPDAQGLKDISEKVTRPVGDPEKRFEEDRLRVLRLVRFFSRFNEGNILDSLDPATEAAIEKFKDLPGVTPERIETEFAAGLQKAKDPASYLENYRRLGLLDRTFQGLNVNADGLDRIGKTRDRAAVLAWLLRDDPQPRSGLNRLKYSNDVANRVQFLVDAMNMAPEDAPRLVRKKESLHLQPNAALAGGAPLSSERIAARNRQLDDELRGQLLGLAEIVPEPEAKIRLRHLAVYQPPKISVEDLLVQGVSGPEIGAEQRRRLEADYRQSLVAFRRAGLAAESRRAAQRGMVMEVWDERLHPRGKNGEFIRKGEEGDDGPLVNLEKWAASSDKPKVAQALRDLTDADRQKLTRYLSQGSEKKRTDRIVSRLQRDVYPVVPPTRLETKNASREARRAMRHGLRIEIAKNDGDAGWKLKGKRAVSSRASTIGTEAGGKYLAYVSMSRFKPDDIVAVIKKLGGRSYTSYDRHKDGKPKKNELIYNSGWNESFHAAASEGAYLLVTGDNPGRLRRQLEPALDAIFREAGKAEDEYVTKKRLRDLVRPGD